MTVVNAKQLRLTDLDVEFQAKSLVEFWILKIWRAKMASQVQHLRSSLLTKLPCLYHLMGQIHDGTCTREAGTCSNECKGDHWTPGSKNTMGNVIVDFGRVSRIPCTWFRRGSISLPIVNRWALCEKPLYLKVWKAYCPTPLPVHPEESMIWEKMFTYTET